MEKTQNSAFFHFRKTVHAVLSSEIFAVLLNCAQILPTLHLTEWVTSFFSEEFPSWDLNPGILRQQVLQASQFFHRCKLLIELKRSLDFVEEVL